MNASRMGVVAFGRLHPHGTAIPESPGVSSGGRRLGVFAASIAAE